MTPDREMVRVIAHRGASIEEIENTSEAFRRAVLEGADGIEMDVRRAKSGELVVFHDDDLKRLARLNLRVEELTLDEIKHVLLRHPSNPSKTGRIPTLDEVLSDEALRRVTLCIEIKGDGIEEDLAGMLRGRNLIDRSIVYSFKPEQLVKVKSIEPRLRVNLLFGGNRYANLRLALESGFDMINPEHYEAEEEFVRLAVELGLTVTVGRTNDPDEIRRIARLPVWGFHTDLPALAAGIVRRAGVGL